MDMMEPSMGTVVEAEPRKTVRAYLSSVDSSVRDLGKQVKLLRTIEARLRESVYGPGPSRDETVKHPDVNPLPPSLEKIDRELQEQVKELFDILEQIANSLGLDDTSEPRE